MRRKTRRHRGRPRAWWRRRDAILRLLRSAGGSISAVAVYYRVSRQRMFQIVTALGLRGAVPRTTSVAPRCAICGKEYAPSPTRGGVAKQKFCRAVECQKEAQRRRFEAFRADPEKRKAHTKAATDGALSPRRTVVLAVLTSGPKTATDLALAVYGKAQYRHAVGLMLRRMERDGLVSHVGDTWTLIPGDSHARPDP